MDQQVGLYVSGMVQDSKKIVKDMISPVPSTLGIGLAYSGYFKPEMGISRVNEFQGKAYDQVKGATGKGPFGVSDRASV